MSHGNSFTRESATQLILREAFAEEGIGVMASTATDEPGTARVDRLLAALEFLQDDLEDEGSLARDFVCALFSIATLVSDRVGGEQGALLEAATLMLLEQWKDWPDFSVYAFPQSPENGEVRVEVLAGYCAGDVSYCRTADLQHVYPVRIVELSRTHLKVEPLVADPGLLRQLFLHLEPNCCFFLPRNSPVSRFGGEDERLVNASRKLGPELRLLPTHYATTAHALIRELHAQDREKWPLPTGRVADNWFPGK